MWFRDWICVQSTCSPPLPCKLNLIYRGQGKRLDLHLTDWLESLAPCFGVLPSVYSQSKIVTRYHWSIRVCFPAWKTRWIFSWLNTRKVLRFFGLPFTWPEFSSLHATSNFDFLPNSLDVFNRKVFSHNTSVSFPSFKSEKFQ